MPSVRSELKGHPFDLETLERLFPAGDPIVGHEGGTYFFESERLAPFANDGSKLHAEAQKILTVLNGTGRADSTGFRLVQLAGKYVADGPAGGRVHQVVSAASAEGRGHVSAAAAVVTRDGAVVFPSPEPSLIALRATTDPRVAEVLELMAAPEQDWVVLYKIFEVVRDAVGGGTRGLLDAGLMTPEERSDFTGSANHPGASGPGARHARQRGGAPKHPMNLAAGREFIRRVVNAWVESLP